MKERLDIRDQTKAAENILSKVAKARFIAIYFIRNKTEFTLKTIGRMFQRDHASIIHALKTIRQVQSLHYETDIMADLKKLSNII
jgi:chromosomal replication initiation ATPase DnaA